MNHELMKLIVPILLSIIERSPQIARAGLDAAKAIRALWESEADPTPAELDALMLRALRAGADLRAVVAIRTGPGGDWAAPA